MNIEQDSMVLTETKENPEPDSDVKMELPWESEDSDVKSEVKIESNEE